MADTKYNYVTGGAKLGFKTGQQATIDSMFANQNSQNPDQSLLATEGTFYLTKDTHRLYVGNNDGSISPVNEGIIKVASVSALPNDNTSNAGNAGTFYYCAQENILAVSTGQGYVQINERTGQLDEHTITIPAEITTAMAAAQTAGNTYSGETYIQSLVKDDTMTGQDPGLKAFLKLAGNNGVKVGLTNTTATANGVSHTDTPTFTITGDTYSISSSEVETTSGDDVEGDIKIAVNSANTNNTSAVTLRPGDNITLTKENNKNIVTVAAVDSHLGDGSLTIEPKHSTVEGQTVYQDGFTFAITDSNGGGDSETFNPKVKLGTNSTEYTFNQGVMTLPVYTKSEIESTLKALNAMTYRGTLGSLNNGANLGTGGYRIENNQSSANFGKIITKVDNADAAVDVKVGDTFLTISPIVYDRVVGGSTVSVTIPAQSIIIAKGTEDADTGYITSNLEYDYVEATQNSDTTYTFTAHSNNGGTGADASDDAYGINLVPSTGSFEYSFSVKGGAGLTASNGTTGANPNEFITTISHDQKSVQIPSTVAPASPVAGQKYIDTATQNAASKNHTAQTTDFTAITNITLDEFGHIATVDKTQITLVDSNAQIGTNTYTTKKENTENGITTVTNYFTNGNKHVGVLFDTIQLQDGNGGQYDASEKAVAFTSETLTFGADTLQKDNVNASTATVNSMNIEMLWGSF